MGRNLTQVIADLPPDRQARIDARYRQMKDDIEGLRELRQVAGKAHADIATASEPHSKMQRKRAKRMVKSR